MTSEWVDCFDIGIAFTNAIRNTMPTLNSTIIYYSS